MPTTWVQLINSRMNDNAALIELFYRTRPEERSAETSRIVNLVSNL